MSHNLCCLIKYNTYAFVAYNSTADSRFLELFPCTVSFCESVLHISPPPLTECSSLSLHLSEFHKCFRIFLLAKVISRQKSRAIFRHTSFLPGSQCHLLCRPVSEKSCSTCFVHMLCPYVRKVNSVPVTS